MIKTHVDCDNDGTITITQYITTHHRRFGDVYELQNVEVEVCPQCGARYYHARSLKDINNRIDEMRQHQPRSAA